MYTYSIHLHYPYMYIHTGIGDSYLTLVQVLCLICTYKPMSEYGHIRQSKSACVVAKQHVTLPPSGILRSEW